MDAKVTLSRFQKSANRFFATPPSAINWVYKAALARRVEALPHFGKMRRLQRCTICRFSPEGPWF